MLSQFTSKTISAFKWKRKNTAQFDSMISMTTIIHALNEYDPD